MFRENICDQTNSLKLRFPIAAFFPLFLPNFATHHEHSARLCPNQGMKRNSSILSFHTLPFHPSAIQAWPLSEQISQFNFIVARGLTMVSSLWNGCDNQIERAHVYLPWRAAAQISSTLKRRALAGVGFIFFFSFSLLQTHPEMRDASWVLSVLQHVTSNKGSAAQMKNFLTAL